VKLLCRSTRRGPLGSPIWTSDTSSRLHSAPEPALALISALWGSTVSRSEPCHRCVTHSRNQEDTEGHRRTRRPSRLSTGGHWRNRQGTGGHDLRSVRDREAPGSNPGPPTKFRIQIEVFACSVWRAGVTGRSQIFLELGGGSPVQVDFEPSIELKQGHRTADISARARPLDRETPVFRIPRPSKGCPGLGRAGQLEIMPLSLAYDVELRTRRV
jgi:hypothetical protein